MKRKRNGHEDPQTKHRRISTGDTGMSKPKIQLITTTIAKIKRYTREGNTQ